MIAKMLGTATVLGSLVLGSAPANAEPLPPEPNPNPFGSLTCECQEAIPGEGPARTGELQRGLNGSHQPAENHRRSRLGVELA